MLDILSEKGYKYIGSIGENEHIFSNLLDDGNLEVFAEVESCARWCLIYDNKEFEFCRSASKFDEGLL